MAQPLPLPALVFPPRPGRPAFSRTPVARAAVLGAALLLGAGVRAQPEDAAAAPRLKGSPRLAETLPEGVRPQLPVFISGDRLQSETEVGTMVEGAAELRRGDTVIRADRLEYLPPDDRALATGNVRINRAGDVFEGPQLDVRVERFEGHFDSPRYQLLKNGAHGTASRVDFVDADRSVVRNATYTTCRRVPGPGWLPEWILRAATLTLDNETETGTASGAALEFYGVPILPVPALSFPLTDRRKSGFLPPTLGVDNKSGVEITQPYYLNLAPNRDATLIPTLMTRRGIDLGGEFRYLEPGYRGELRASYMPNDRLRDRDRWSYALQHSGGFDAGSFIGGLGIALNLNRVSDDNYWRDFSRTIPSLTQRLLVQDAVVSWGRGDFTASARTQKWQVLQDATAPITPPYDRLPQLNARYARYDVGGFDWSIDGDTTRFRGDPALTRQPDGTRSFTLAQLSRPIVTPGWFITPKAMLHATRYRFDAPLASGRTDADRVVPTLSLDSGLVLERSARFFGRDFTQTLEPRAFYVYTPFRAQNDLPNYDSAQNDFNFATVYTENAFGGNDRISDSNLLTLGVSSRLLDPDTGAEAVRVGVAQRLRFKDQRVVLPGGQPVSDRLSDVLLGGTINWTPQWMLDTSVQYNPDTKRSIRTTIGGRYSPGNYRTVSAAYRLQRGVSEQIDLGWQWPINDLWGDRGVDLGEGRGQGPGRWYAVGRLNVSIKERRLVDSILGFEYDADCWVGRVVVERLQSSLNTSNKRILFQLEFVGFTRLGSSPLRTLKENIPRYQYLREQVSTPSRFSHYD